MLWNLNKKVVEILRINWSQETMQFFWSDFKAGFSGFCLVVISIFLVAKLVKLEKRLGAARVFSDEHSR
jgi:hypothetical protein